MSKSKMSPEPYNSGYFERSEGSNYTNYGDDPGWRQTLQALAPYLKPGCRIREVACAKGWFVFWARNLLYDAEGIDISPHAVASAPLDVREHLHLGNAVKLPWSAKSTDVVCSWEFLEHVPEDELDRVLTEMERVLKNDGLMIHRVGILNDEADLSNHMHDHTHVTNYPETWWRDLLEKRGWRRMVLIEQALNDAFEGRDWKDRFFVYKKK